MMHSATNSELLLTFCNHINPLAAKMSALGAVLMFTRSGVTTAAAAMLLNINGVGNAVTGKDAAKLLFLGCLYSQFGMVMTLIATLPAILTAEICAGKSPIANIASLLNYTAEIDRRPPTEILQALRQ